MPKPATESTLHLIANSAAASVSDNHAPVPSLDPLLTVEQVASRLNVSKDWVWDHSSRKSPMLPVIRMGDGTLRYRASKIEEFIDEREHLTKLQFRRVK